MLEVHAFHNWRIRSDGKFALGYQLKLIWIDSQYTKHRDSKIRFEGLENLPNVILIETSVFSTIFVNSSKLIFPSRSVSASMIVLSTIFSAKSNVSTHDLQERFVHHP